MKTFSQWWDKRCKLQKLPINIKNRMSEIKAEIAQLKDQVDELRGIHNERLYMLMVVLGGMGGPIFPIPDISIPMINELPRHTQEQLVNLEERIQRLKNEYDALLNTKIEVVPGQLAPSSVAENPVVQDHSAYHQLNLG